MTLAAPTTVIFDIGGVLIDWNPRHLYRKLFDGDEAAMERFLATVCNSAWNERQDAGRRALDFVDRVKGTGVEALDDPQRVSDRH